MSNNPNLACNDVAVLEWSTVHVGEVLNVKSFAFYSHVRLVICKKKIIKSYRLKLYKRFREECNTTMTYMTFVTTR